MIVNVLGNCDRRPLTYTLMKLFQAYGDVLVTSNVNRILRLSDTGESEGHYQNIMIAYTPYGLDDFWDSFEYNPNDFEHKIIDGILSPDADIFFYCQSREETENEVDEQSYIDSNRLIKVKLYAKETNYFNQLTMYNLEEFESLRDMCSISDKLNKDVAKVVSPHMRIPEATIYKTLMTKNFIQPKSSGILPVIKRR